MKIKASKTTKTVQTTKSLKPIKTRYTNLPFQLQIKVNWPLINKKFKKETIQESTATKTYRKLIEQLFERLGRNIANNTIIAAKCNKKPIISSKPETDFKLKDNTVRYHRIGKTKFFLNTNSCIKTKIKQIKSIATQMQKDQKTCPIEAIAIQNAQSC